VAANIPGLGHVAPAARGGVGRTRRTVSTTTVGRGLVRILQTTTVTITIGGGHTRGRRHVTGDGRGLTRGRRHATGGGRGRRHGDGHTRATVGGRDTAVVPTAVTRDRGHDRTRTRDGAVVTRADRTRAAAIDTTALTLAPTRGRAAGRATRVPAVARIRPSGHMGGTGHSAESTVTTAPR